MIYKRNYDLFIICVIIFQLKKMDILMDYKLIAKTIIKTELQKKNINYVDLAEKLNKLGHTETNITLANKINRGKFGFDFALAVLNVIGADDMKIGEYLK